MDKQFTEKVILKIAFFNRLIDDWIDDVIDGNVIKQIGGLGITGVGLLFDGGPGIGKTTHAVLTAMELVRRMPQEEDEARKILRMNSSDFAINSMRSIF